MFAFRLRQLAKGALPLFALEGNIRLRRNEEAIRT